VKTTQIMTVGTALRRAMDARVEATVYVGPHQLCGLVEDIDSHGVLLWDDVDDVIRVVKMDSIDAVQIARAAADPEAIPLRAVGE